MQINFLKKKISFFSVESQNPTHHLPALTGIRAIAAYMVFCHHYTLFPKKSILYALCNELYIGVSIFFVLSGFLITWRYADACQKSKTWYLSYLKKRFIRIYPTYFLLTVLTFLVYWVFKKLPHNSWKDNIGLFLLNISLLKGFCDEIKFSGIAQAWSLTVEECFYAIAPLFFWVRHHLLKNGTLILLLIVIGISYVEIGFIFELDSCISYTFVSSYTFFGRFGEFLMGMGLAYYCLSPHKKTMIFPFTWVGGLWILLVLVALMLFKGNYTYGIYTLEGVFVNNVVLPLGVVLFFKGLLYEKTLLRNVLETPIFQLLGKSSYIFYLIHIGIFALFIQEYIHYHPLVVFLCIQLLSILLYVYVERPLHRFLSKIF